MERMKRLPSISKRQRCHREYHFGPSLHAYAAVPIYRATKAALHSFSQSLPHQLRTTSITVVEIAPPLVQSEVHDHQEDVVMPSTAMPTAEFVSACVAPLGDDRYTVLVGMVETLQENSDESFPALNYIDE